MAGPLPTAVDCPVETTLAVLGGRWKVLILHELLQGVRRFGGLLKALPNISPKMLAQQLRELERQGIVHRQVYPQVPLKVEYSLTACGRSLKSVLEVMHTWGKQHTRERHRFVLKASHPSRHG